MKKLILIAAALFLALSTSAKVGIKEPFSDGMILQQKTDALLKGTASPGARISVTTGWDKATYSAKTDKGGVWETRVKTPEASYTPYDIEVSGDGSSLTIKNVLIGEVWIASGQSNMEMPLRGFTNCPVEGYLDAVSAPSLKDKVRYFNVIIRHSYEKEYDMGPVSGWLDVDSFTVGEMSATAYFFAVKVQSMLDVPVGILSLPRGGATVESWLPKETLEAWGDDVSREAIDKQTEWTRSYVMYNGMQIPARRYTAKGFIWYQGCSNVGREDQFVERMAELIRQWREQDWEDRGDLMPFYMCEIAPYNYEGDQDEHAAALRAAQHEVAAKVPNCECIVTNDLAYPYEIDNIHPSQKKPVGERLAYLALNRDYGFSKIPCYSPVATKAYTEVYYGKRVVALEVTHGESGVSRMKDVEALELVCADGTIVPVTEAKCDYDITRVPIPDGIEPVEIRYGWGDFKPGNLKNCNGLPFTPFKLKIQQ